jgi:hypothetical protein
MGLTASEDSSTIRIFIYKLQQYSLLPEGHLWVTLQHFHTFDKNLVQILDFYQNTCS